MLYAKKVVESVGLEVELPMVLSMDNHQAAVDLANGLLRVEHATWTLQSSLFRNSKSRMY
jgi:hypothetical protein